MTCAPTIALVDLLLETYMWKSLCGAVLRSRVTHVSIIALGLAGAVMAGIAWHHRVYSYWDYQVYQAMKWECHPVWAEFNFRKIGAGHDVEDLIEEAKPSRVTRFGDFTHVTYGGGFTGVEATAYKGKLVSACAPSCCWTKIFFDVRTPDQKKLEQKQYDEYMQPIWNARDRDAQEERHMEIVINAWEGRQDAEEE